MTLIVSLVTPAYVMQVSDRNLSNRDGVVSRSANKSIFFGNQIIFGYCGASDVGGVPTEDWLASQLVKHPASDFRAILQSLVDSAAQDNDEGRPLGIVAAGWSSGNECNRNSFMAMVSNYHDQFEQQRVHPTKEFVGRYSLDDRPRWGVMAMGLKLDHSDLWRLRRQLRRCVEHRSSARTLSKMAVAFIRSIAADNYSVGHDLMVSLMPRDAVETGAFTKTTGGHIVLGGGVNVDPANDLAATMPQFVYVPTGTSVPVASAPVVVVPGRAIIAGVEMFNRPLSREEQTEMYLKSKRRSWPRK